MADHTIFLLHGMGMYGKVASGAYKPDQDGWFKQAKASLEEAYDTHIKATEIGGKVAFSKRFDVVFINYDSWFERYRQAWAAQAKEWKKLNLPIEWFNSLGDFLSGAGDDDFGWTHIADTLMYIVPTIRDAVVSGVEADMLSHLEKNPGPYSIIAHSLGTAVMHDTFAGLVSTLQERAPAAKPPRVVCSVANVARALTNMDVNAYGNAIAPSTKGFHPRWYLNYNHQLDLISRIDHFNPKFGPWSQQQTDGAFFSREFLTEYYVDPGMLDWKGVSLTDALKELMPHGFGHYMAQPEVVASLWPALMGVPVGKHYATIAKSVRAANAAKQDEALKKELEKRINAGLGELPAEAEKDIKYALETIVKFAKGFL